MYLYVMYCNVLGVEGMQHLRSCFTMARDTLSLAAFCPLLATLDLSSEGLDEPAWPLSPNISVTVLVPD